MNAGCEFNQRIKPQREADLISAGVLGLAFPVLLAANPSGYFSPLIGEDCPEPPMAAVRKDG